MATVTGYTAARMQAIEDAAIVSGTIVGDDLILTRFDASTINAGNVRGPQGVQGPVGEVTTAAMTAAITAATTAGAIGTSALAPDAVTNDKLADNAVRVENIAALAVNTGEIANGAVTTSKIGAQAVTADKILGGTIETTKLADSAVTHAKVAPNTISHDQLKSPFLSPESISPSNGWGGTLYYMGFTNLVFFWYDRISPSATDGLMLTWPVGVRPIRTTYIPVNAPANPGAYVWIATNGEMRFSEGSPYSTRVMIMGFFEREQFA